jgi:hypothetical protein
MALISGAISVESQSQYREGSRRRWRDWMQVEEGSDALEALLIWEEEVEVKRRRILVLSFTELGFICTRQVRTRVVEWSPDDLTKCPASA